jgi:hypothetical protein
MKILQLVQKDKVVFIPLVNGLFRQHHLPLHLVVILHPIHYALPIGTLASTFQKLRVSPSQQGNRTKQIDIFFQIVA